MATDKNSRTVFISAVMKDNIDELKNILYDEVKKIHVRRYPFNDFLFNAEESIE
jgi:GTP-binding protein HflX